MVFVPIYQSNAHFIYLIYQKEIRFHYETFSNLINIFLGCPNGVTLKYDLANLVLFIFIYMNLQLLPIAKEVKIVTPKFKRDWPHTH
jgi:hypothetical protein